MSRKEFARLRGYYKNKQPSAWKPIYESKGRRSIKNKAKHVGFILKDSSVSSEPLSIERGLSSRF